MTLCTTRSFTRRLFPFVANCMISPGFRYMREIHPERRRHGNTPSSGFLIGIRLRS
jgi:hypothetical protein